METETVEELFVSTHMKTEGVHSAWCARIASAMQLFGRVAVLETHTL